MQQGGMSQGTSAIPSADSVDDLEARFRALSGQPGGGDGGGGGNLQSLQHGAVVQNSQPMPDFLDELDSMWKQSASAARAVEPALARVDAALAELEASARSVGAGKLLARSAVPPTNGNDPPPASNLHARHDTTNDTPLAHNNACVVSCHVCRVR
jgi:hypothetical protein